MKHIVVTIVAITLATKLLPSASHAQVAVMKCPRGGTAEEIKRNKQSCLQQFQRRLYLTQRFQRNYDPRMKEMLSISVITAKAVQNIRDDSNRSSVSKILLIALKKRQQYLQNQAATINTKELGDYALKVLGTIAKEGVDVVAKEIEKVTEYIPPAKNINLAAKLAPGSIEIVKTIVTAFPKIELHTHKDAKNWDKNKRETWGLISLIAETNEFNSADPELLEVLDPGFSTFWKESYAVDEAKLASDPAAQGILAVDKLIDYQTDQITISIKKSQTKITRAVEDSTRAIKGSISAARNVLIRRAAAAESRILAGQAGLRSGQRALLRGQKTLLKGQKDLKYGQTYIISGVDYLYYRAREQEEFASVDALEGNKLDQRIRVLTESAGSPACASVQGEKTGQAVHFDASTRAQQTCVLHTAALDRAQKRKSALNRQYLAQTANATVGIASDLAVIFDDPKLQKLADDADKALTTFNKVQEAIDAVQKAQQIGSVIGSMASIMTGVGAVTTAISLFSKSSGPSADQLILKGIQELKQQIADLRKDMVERFDALNDKLDKLAILFNDALVAQTRVLNSSIVTSIAQQNESSDKIYKKLDELGLINENVQNISIRQNYIELTNAANQFESQVELHKLSSAASILVGSYSARSYIYDSLAQDQFPTLTDFSRSSLFEDTNKIINLTADKKLSSAGRYSILSAINSLDPTIPDSCRQSTFQYLLFASLITRRFVDAANKSQDMGGHHTTKWELALSLPDVLDRSSLADQLDQALNRLIGLQLQAEKCVGLHDNEYGIVENLHAYYQEQIEEHINSTSARLAQERSSFRAQVLNRIKQDSNIKFGADKIFNGQLPAGRKSLNDGFVYAAKASSLLNDPAFASKHFEAHKWPDIHRCFPGSKRNQVRIVKSLRFPIRTIDEIIKLPQLKYALTSGLIQWKWCFEVGDYDKRTGKLVVVISARERHVDGEPVKGVWRIPLVVPGKLRGSIGKSFKKTSLYFRGIYNTKSRLSNRLFERAKRMQLTEKDKERIIRTEFVESCKPDRKIHTSIEFGPAFPPKSPVFDENLTEPLNVVAIEQVVCRELSDTYTKLWNKQAVDSARAWDQYSAEAGDCRDHLYGMMFACAPKKSERLINC